MKKFIFIVLIIFACLSLTAGIFFIVRKPAQDETECKHENVETVYGKAATYTETGLTDGSKCADCGLILVEQQEIPVLDASARITETLLISDYAIANGWDNAKKYDTANLGANISMRINGGNNSGKFYEGNQWRLYQTESASLTIAAAEGYAIYNIRITYSYSDGGILVGEGGAGTYPTNEDIILNGEQSFTVSVANRNASGSSGQVRITAIEITYAVVPQE